MATRYLSNLWVARATRGTSAGADTTTTAYEYRGPYAARAGDAFDVIGTYTNTVADPFAVGTSDQLLICPMPKNGMLVDFKLATSADLDTDNNFTFNLGYTGALTQYISAGTGLQAAVTTLTSQGILTAGITGGGPTNNTSNLILSAQAGTLEAAGIIVVHARIVVAY